MALSYELISQFAKLTKSDNKTNTESTVYGTIKVDENGNKYVKLDGSDQLTPLDDENRPVADTTMNTAANANDGERVSVLIKNHTATVTGNISSPAARTGDVEKLEGDVTKIQEFDILIGEQVRANEAYIKKLQTDKAEVGDLTAATAKITELEAKKASVEDLNATTAEITNLKTTKLDAEIANAKFATIENLAVTNQKVNNIEGEHASFRDFTAEKLSAVDAEIEDLTAKDAEIEKLVAKKASVEDLEAANANIANLTAKDAEIENVVAENLKATNATFENLVTKYANIDFANIDMAAVEQLFAKSGMIERLSTENGYVTGMLVGVTIKGDIIEGNTIVADKLVVKGDDGLYYKLNTQGVTKDTFEVKYEKTETTIEAVNGTLMRDVTTTSGTEVYYYDDGGVQKYYTIVDDLYYTVDAVTTDVKMAQTEYNSLNGSVITAKSVTAEQIHVTDLVAFGATIGGFHITDTSIYSEVKDSENNTIRGIYFDTDGQVNIGDNENYIRYVKNEDGTYSLAISAKSIMYALNGTNRSLADLGNIGEYVKIGTYKNEQGTEEPCIELGEKDSNFKLIITNTRILFMDGDDAPAYITNQALRIKKAVVEDELYFGQFVWRERENGNMGIIWVEAEEATE